MDGYNPITRSHIAPLDLLADAPNAGGSQGFYPSPDTSPGGAVYDPNAIALVNDQLRKLLRASWKFGKVLQKPFTVGTTPAVLLPEDANRRYFFIINISAVNRLWLGFDVEPDAAASRGMPVEVNLGFYEPLYTPTNQIYVAGAGAGTQGILLYSSEA